MVDVIIPTKNELKNLDDLVLRVHKSLSDASIEYLITFVDDHSNDGTLEKIKELSKSYNIQYFLKNGKQGKGYSIMEGLKLTRNEQIVFLDADLQYPPENLPEMLALLNKHGVVVANRTNYKSKNILRKLISRSNSFLLGKLIYNYGCDIQSGMKAFRRSILTEVKSKNVGKWTFDLQLLNASYHLGQTIGTVDINFENRLYGSSKVSILGTSIEIFLNALKVKLTHIGHVVHMAPKMKNSMLHAGMLIRGKKYVTHTTLNSSISAANTLSKKQFYIILLFLFGFALSIIFSTFNTIFAFVALISALYFTDTISNLYLVFRSLAEPPEYSYPEIELDNLLKGDLPKYTILCPLYKEHSVLKQFVDNMLSLKWQANKLEVMLLLEEDDVKTIEVAHSMNLPSQFKIVVVPHSFPKTKPKACNYGLNIATGKYIVIYDAEDKPDEYQLLKAYKTFQDAPKNVFCVQAKLNYYNPNQNLITKLFTSEYSLWFDVTLTGMQSINTNIPLGGTSNHFRTRDLRLIEGWDAFNVAEDCDLGARLFKKGFRTAIIDSVTYEEATSNLKNWIRQRSRWIKGYMQTYLVHMRNPVSFAKSHGIHMALFQLTIGGKILSILINPILWITTIAYFAFYNQTSHIIEAFYPNLILYFAAFSLLVGNFLAIYYYMIGNAKRGNYSLIKYSFAVPLYWLIISIAGYMALYQLITKPHYWEKTNHGHHLNKSKKLGINLGFEIGPLRLPFEKQFSLLFGFSNLSNHARQIYSNFILRVSHTAVFIWFSYNYISGSIISSSYSIAPVYFYFAIMILTLALEKSSDFVVISRKTFNKDIKQKIGEIDLVANLFILTFFGFTAFLFLQDYQLNQFYFFVAFLVIGIFHTITSFLKEQIFLSSIWLAYILYTSIEIILEFASLSNLDFINKGIVPNFMFALITLVLSASISLKILKSKRKLYFSNPTKYFLMNLRHLDQYIFQFSVTIYFWSGLAIAYMTWDMSSFLKYLIYWILTSGFLVFSTALIDFNIINFLASKKPGINLHIFKMTIWSIIYSTFFDIVFIVFGSTFVQNIYGFSFISFVTFTLAIAIEKYIKLSLYSYTTYRKSNRNRTLFLSSIPLLLYPFVFTTHSQDVYRFIVTSLSTTFIWLFVVLYSEGIADQINFHLSKIIRYLLGYKITPNTSFYSNLGGLHFLIFNWRDTKHKWAGGAEVYIHELSKELINNGHKVTIFCGNDTHSKVYEEIDGIKIIRRGGFYLVYLHAVLFYIFNKDEKYDVIIDSANGIPFFTPIFSTLPKFLLIHHIHQEIFKKHLKFPLSYFAMFTESFLMPVVYRNTKVITVSESTASETQSLGFDTDNITVINPGVSVPRLNYIENKSLHPKFIYLGRLMNYKNVDKAIIAFQSILTDYKNAEFVIIGDGMARDRLKKMVNTLKLSDSIKFLGKVSEEIKYKELSSSWAAIQPSSKEGWGITVIESNIVGTPVIASNVSGLRDAIKDKTTGLLFELNNVENLQKLIEKIIQDPDTRYKLSNNSKDWALNFSWNNAVLKLERLIKHELLKSHDVGYLASPNLSYINEANK